MKETGWQGKLWEGGLLFTLLYILIFAVCLLFISFYFLAVPDTYKISWARNWTGATVVATLRPQLLGHQGTPTFYLFKLHFGIPYHSLWSFDQQFPFWELILGLGWKRWVWKAQKPSSIFPGMNGFRPLQFSPLHSALWLKIRFVAWRMLNIKLLSVEVCHVEPELGCF